MDKKVAIMAAVVVLLAAAIIIVGIVLFRSDDSESYSTYVYDATGSDTETTTEAATELTYSGTNPLTGESNYNEEYEDDRPVAVVVENTPEARPQWGLTTPDIIIETEVEGGITRMLWIYASVNNMPSKVGPVRSARDVFVELASGFGALFVHYGGSDSSYTLLSSVGLDDVDGLYDSGYFSRDTSRSVSSEHTAYTTCSWIANAFSGFGYSDTVASSYSNLYSFSSESSAATGSDCTSVSVYFSDDFIHTFTYNSSDNLYYNYLNSEEMVDEYGTQSSFTNIVILFTTITNTGDSSGHLDISLSSGSGYLVSGGKVVAIKWSKGSTSSALRLYDTSGNELVLGIGKTWIGITRNGYSSYCSFTA